jgi:hypothetical protein
MKNVNSTRKYTANKMTSALREMARLLCGSRVVGTSDARPLYGSDFSRYLVDWIQFEVNLPVRRGIADRRRRRKRLGAAQQFGAGHS